MKTKTKILSLTSILRFISFIFLGIFLYNSYFVTNASWSPSNKIHKVKCIKDGFGDYTGSGYVDIEFKSDEEATYNRRYLLDRPGKIYISDFNIWGANVKICPNFVAPAANSCQSKSTPDYEPWLEYDSVKELGVLVNSDAPITRDSNSLYSTSGNYTTVAGFGGTGFIDTENAFYDETQKTYTFFNSLVQVDIRMGDDTVAGSGFIKLYQTPTSGAGSGTLRVIEKLTFFNENSASGALYSAHNIGVPGGTYETLGNTQEFFYTGSLFTEVDQGEQAGSPITLVNSNISLSGAVIGLSGSTLSLTAGVFGTPTSVITLKDGASVSLSGSTISLSGNTISLTDTSIVGNGLDFGMASPFLTMNPISLGTLIATPFSLNGSNADFNGALGSLINTGSLDGDIISLSGSNLGGANFTSINTGSLNGDIISLNNSTLGGTGAVSLITDPILLNGETISLINSTFSNGGSTGGTGSIILGNESTILLSNNISSTGSVVLLDNGVFSLSGSIISSTGSFFGGSGTVISSIGSITLGAGSNVLINSIPVPLNGSIISLSGSIVGSSGSIVLGSDTLLSLNNNTLLSTSNGLVGDITLGIDSLFSLSNNITSTGSFVVLDGDISLSGSTILLDTSFFGGTGSIQLNNNSDIDITDFETNTLGNWTEVAGLSANVSFQTRSGGTPSSSTGPNAAANGSYYIYAETSNPNSPGKTFAIETDYYNKAQNLSFDYHMYGVNMGNLVVQTFNGSVWTDVYTLSGQQQAAQGNPWLNTGDIDLIPYVTEKIRIFYTSGTDYRGDASIDNIKIESASAPDVILGSGATVMLDSRLISLSGSMISLNNLTLLGSDSVMLGDGSLLSLTDNILSSSTNSGLDGDITLGTDSLFSLLNNVVLTGSILKVDPGTISLSGSVVSLPINISLGNDIIDFETPGTSGFYSVITNETGVNSDWSRETSTTKEGTFSLEANNSLNDNETGCFEIDKNMSSDFTLDFWKSVDSEEDYDWLKFYINGVFEDKWSGNIAWSQESYSLLAGSYTFKWCYNKDVNTSIGDDSARVDYIEIKEELIDSIILGSGATVMLDTYLVSLSGSIISLENSILSGTGNIILGSGSLLSLDNDILYSGSSINGVSPSIILGGGRIILGPTSTTTLNGTGYLGFGELVLERRLFSRIENGYIKSSVNEYDHYFPEKGVGSKSKNIEKGNSGKVNSCDTEATVEDSGGDKCPESVNKAYIEGSLESVKLSLKKTYLKCEMEHFNPLGSIDSDTTIIIVPTSTGTIISNTVIIPIADFVSFSTGAKINGGGFDYLGRMIVEATSGTYNIEGLNYHTEFIAGGTLEQIVGKLTIPGDITEVIGDGNTDLITWNNKGLGVYNYIDSIDNSMLTNESYTRGDYSFMLEFYDKTASGNLLEVDNIIFPLTIVPTNNMGIVGEGTRSYPGGGFPHANNDQMNDHSDVTQICYNIQDEFKNPIGYDSYAPGGDRYKLLTDNIYDYNVTRSPDYGDYQTGTGYRLDGTPVDFSVLGSHLLSEAHIVIGGNSIRLRQDGAYNAGNMAVEIKDNNSGPYSQAPSYAYTGPSDTKHLVTFKGSKMCFNIQSYAPSNKKLRFDLVIPTHNLDYDLTPDGGTSPSITNGVAGMTANALTSTNVRFEKPFYGNFVIDDDGEFKVGTEQTMRIDVVKNDGECSAVVCNSDFTLSNYMNDFRSINGFYSVLRKDTEINTNGTVSSASVPTPWMVPLTSDRTKLDFVLNYISGDKISSHSTYGVMSRVWITNNVDGKDVRYVLNNQTGGNTSRISQNRTAFYGVKADGVIEGESENSNQAGYTITGQQSSFTKVDKLEMRKQIKSNAYDLIRGRSSDTILDEVKYLDGTIDGDADGNIIINATPVGTKTLIIKNGNLVITDNILSNIGIIIIKDDLANKELGNIYVTPSVREIRAMIYLDGSIISKTNVAGVYYTDDGSITGNPEDTPTRTRELQTQLILKGSLFSRNTVGGAIGSAPFTCPGGRNCASFDEAVQYDLNYIRRGFDFCDHNADADCLDVGEYMNVGFVVEYNPDNQINPPKGFENN